MRYAVENYQREHIPQIVALHIACWKNNYRGLVAQESLDSIDTNLWLERRYTHFENPGRIKLMIRDGNGLLLGFADGGKARDADFENTGELYALYVIPGAQGSGIGRALLLAMKERLAAAGFSKMLVKTLLNNPHSRGFYEKLGGSFLAKKSAFDFDGRSYEEAVYLFALGREKSPPSPSAI